jgi:hypothetical protein
VVVGLTPGPSPAAREKGSSAPAILWRRRRGWFGYEIRQRRAGLRAAFHQGFGSDIEAAAWVSRSRRAHSWDQCAWRASRGRRPRSSAGSCEDMAAISQCMAHHLVLLQGPAYLVWCAQVPGWRDRLELCRSTSRGARLLGDGGPLRGPHAPRMVGWALARRLGRNYSKHRLPLGMYARTAETHALGKGYRARAGCRTGSVR